MAPWDELIYFASPTTTFSASFTTGSQLCKANPMRVWLAICNDQAGASVFVGLRANASANEGWVLSSANPTLKLTAKDDPTLVQSAWFLNSGPAITMTVIEVMMLLWPEGTNSDNANVQPANGRALPVDRRYPDNNSLSAATRATLRRLWDALPRLR